MGDPMRIRAVAKGGSVIVKILMSHPMETGQRKGSDGKRIPPHFIQHVSATWQGKTVAGKTNKSVWVRFYHIRTEVIPFSALFEGCHRVGRQGRNIDAGFVHELQPSVYPCCFLVGMDLHLPIGVPVSLADLPGRACPFAQHVFRGGMVFHVYYHTITSGFT